MNPKQYLAIIASSVSILAGVTVLSAAASAETFVISNSIGNSNKALNTNRNFRLIDGHPKMSIWTHNINDADQHFDRLQGARGGQLLRHRSTGKCLNAYRRWNGAEVNVYPCNANDPDQNFNVENLSNGDVQIRLSEIRNNVRFCIDSPTRNDGGAVTLWQCNSGVNQRFKIKDVIIDPNKAVQRAKSWVDRAILYNQGRWFEGYRQDCSGLVSMAWELKDNFGRPISPVTSTLPQYATTLSSKSQLLPGDAINNRGIGDGGHVVLFVRWLDQASGKFIAYEQNGGYGKAVQTTLTLGQDSRGFTIREYNRISSPWYLERKK
jgi:cell wall-associated NlpC family hydrolase